MPVLAIEVLDSEGYRNPAFLWEGVLTFFLMFVIMAVATDAGGG